MPRAFSERLMYVQFMSCVQGVVDACSVYHLEDQQQKIIKTKKIADLIAHNMFLSKIPNWPLPC